MTLLSIMQSDIATVFTAADSSPQSVGAIYTPPGGIAQAAIRGLFNGVPLHGDPYGEYPVEPETYVFAGKASDMSGWTVDGLLYLNSTTYQLTGAPYPDVNNSLWSRVDLRLPLNAKTRI